MAVSQAPSVTLEPAAGQLNLYNHGDTDLQVWGDKLEGSTAEIARQAQIVPKDGFYSFPTSKLRATTTSSAEPNQTVPFEVYLSDQEGRRYIATFDLEVASGKMTVDSQTPGLRLADGFGSEASN